MVACICHLIFPAIKTMPYTERLKACKLPTLHYRLHTTGDMIEMHKILSGKYDTDVTVRVNREYSSITRGNDLRLQNKNSSGDEIANVNFFYNIAHVEASAYDH